MNESRSDAWDFRRACGLWRGFSCEIAPYSYLREQLVSLMEIVGMPKSRREVTGCLARHKARVLRSDGAASLTLALLRDRIAIGPASLRGISEGQGKSESHDD